MKRGRGFPIQDQRLQRHFHRRAILLLLGSALLFLLLAWIPVSVHAANATSTFHKAPLSSIQGTPPVDPTVTALQKEKLVHDTNWFWNFGATLITSLASILALLGGSIFALMKWFGDRQAERERREDEQRHLLEDRQAEREKQDREQKRWLEDRQAEREKRSEEHFQSVVEGLGSTSQAAQVGAAITLRTFLRPGYEQFYRQSFDLAVAHLRLRHVITDTAEPLDSLSQALITIFKESFPLARQYVKNVQQLDAASIQLDNAYLAGADLERAWMPQTYLRQADLVQAHLSLVNLSGANLSGVHLNLADLRKAHLVDANLSGAHLSFANLSGANLSRANLSRADLSFVHLSGANFSGADLSGANLSGADLSEAIGLVQSQLEVCKTKGAII